MRMRVCSVKKRQESFSHESSRTTWIRIIYAIRGIRGLEKILTSSAKHDSDHGRRRDVAYVEW